MSVKICFCYSREDEPLLKKLKAHFRPMQKEGLIEIWYDRDISAGMEWEAEIKKQLETAEIILLLISSDFMDSEYCYSTEMQQALARHEDGEAKVIPIILRPVYWQGILGKIQALPKDGLAVTDPEWHNIDRALFNVAEGIRAIVIEVKTQQYLAEADRLFYASKYHEAISLCDKIIALNVSYTDAYARKGHCVWCLDQYEKALIAFDQAIFYGPDEPIFYVWKGEILSELSRYEEALTCYDQTISLDPTSIDGYYSKGIALQKLQRYEEALTAYDQLIHLDKGSYTYKHKGEVLLSLARYEDALIAYNQSLQLEPNDEETLSKNGEILQRLNREQEALIVYEKIIQIAPTSITGYLGKGKILFDGNISFKDEFENIINALDIYEKAIKVAPDSSQAWHGKGKALLMLERSEEALAALTRSIELNPLNSVAWHHKAMVYEELARQSNKKAEQLGYHLTIPRNLLDGLTPA